MLLIQHAVVVTVDAERRIFRDGAILGRWTWDLARAGLAVRTAWPVIA